MSATILAAGAWLKNTACLWDDGQLHWSPLHGDLGDPDACRALDVSLRRLAHLGRAPVGAVAHDLHPDFFSTQLARRLAEAWGVPAVPVQHHHAHIAVVMADHGLHEPVVGLALDGVGLGTDGTAWGGELLWVAPGEWQRLGSFTPLALPGGDVAAREPWRMVAAVLHALGRGSEIEARCSAGVGPAAARGVQRMLAARLNCPTTSSAGRWFDAAAGALGLSVRQSHEAEAAMALERLAATWLDGRTVNPLTGLVDERHLDRLDPRPLVQGLIDWPARSGQQAEAAAWFHVSLAHALVDWAAAAAHRTGTRTVCLGGGCFHNAVLREHVMRGLQDRGLRALRPITNCGDAGLALGQAWVAAHEARGRSTAASSQESVSCV